jgi:hypothetical protein
LIVVSCVSKRVGWALAAAVAVSGLLALACSTPTLPLPPPAALTATEPDVDGIVIISGEVLPNAFVFVLNEGTEAGVIVRAGPDGRFSAAIAAEVGQTIIVWQEVGTDRGGNGTWLVRGPRVGDAGP